MRALNCSLQIYFPVQLLCRLFTSSSSNCDNVGKETRKEYKARYYRENKEYWVIYYRENKEHHPEKFERYRELSKARRQRPEVLRREQEYHRQRYADRNYAQRQLMAHWLLHRCPDRDLFQWKSHVPIVYDERVRKTCTSCGRSHRAGARLWWKRRHHASPEKQPDSTGLENRTDSTDHELYDCHQCYTNGMSDMSRIMPVGHESHIFGIGMKYPKPSRPEHDTHKRVRLALSHLFRHSLHESAANSHNQKSIMQTNEVLHDMTTQALGIEDDRHLIIRLI